jgi:hypothetical protein
VQVGASVGPTVGVLVAGASDGALLGALLGALVGATVGSGVNVQITGGFRGIKHWLAVKACETKIADDPTGTIKRTRMAAERNMVIVVISFLQTSLFCPTVDNLIFWIYD